MLCCALKGSDVAVLASDDVQYQQAAFEAPLLQLFQQALELSKVPLPLAPAWLKTAGCCLPLAAIFVAFELELHDEWMQGMDLQVAFVSLQPPPQHCL